MAAGDNSPTSGGNGDVIRTEDTATDTNTGIAGAKVALGKILVGRKGQDEGDASIDSPLDVHDARAANAQEQWSYELVMLLAGISEILGRSGVPMQWANGSAVTVSSVTSKTTSQVVAAADPNRKSLMIVNDSTATGTLYLRIGTGTASSASGGYTVPLLPGAYWEAPPMVATQAVQGIWSVAAGFANVTEVQ